RMKAAAAAVATLDDAAISAYLRDDTLTLDVDGEPITLGAGDLLVSAEGVEGWLVGHEDGVTVALDSILDDSLVQRGLAREVVNRIQRLRKQAEFHVADRIRIEYRTETEALAAAIKRHAELVSRETLARRLTPCDNP